jgi:hypothetical protein
MGVTDADGAICYGVLNALPRDLKVTALQRMKDCVKPGAYMWLEDLSFTRPLENFSKERREQMEANPHIFNSVYFDDWRPLFE